MDYLPVSLKALRSKHLTLSDVCALAHMHVWQWVGGRQC